MPTRFIGLKEFRQHMAEVCDEALQHKRRIIILKKNRPIFELVPLSTHDADQLGFDYEATKGADGSYLKASKSHTK